MAETARRIGQMLTEKGLTLGTVESASGGLIAKLITDIPGSSAWFRGAVVSYSNEVKVKLAGVDAATISQYGAVSPETAAEMAAGGRLALEADICLSDTGIAGPGGGSAEKPVGLFYFGLAHGGGTITKEHRFEGERTTNRESAAAAALQWLAEFLEDYS